MVRIFSYGLGLGHLRPLRFCQGFRLEPLIALKRSGYICIAFFLGTIHLTTAGGDLRHEFVIKLRLCPDTSGSVRRPPTFPRHIVFCEECLFRALALRSDWIAGDGNQSKYNGRNSR
jgi:hypothetical protein